MKLFFHCVFFLASLTAAAQKESGTLIVLNASQNEIVVAADSRSLSEVAQFDNRCKITALGNQLIFAASGDTGYGPTDGRSLYWDAHTIAQMIFLRLYREKTAKPMPVRLAETWGKEVKSKLKSDLKRDKQGTLCGVEDNTLTSALFAGFYDGSPFIITGAITYSISPNGVVATSFSITNIFRRPQAVFLGREDIANELFTGKTPRSVQWRQSVAMMTTPSDDAIALPAIEAIRFSIEHYPLKNIGGELLPPIGGPIDAVRLTQAKGVEWIQRKESCQLPHATE
jgi:hypothetical protein